MKSRELLPFSKAPQRQPRVKAKVYGSFPGLPSHKTTGCKTTEVYSLTILKVKSWKPRYQPAVSKAPGRNHARPPFWLLVAADGAWRPWLWQHCSSLCLCLHVGLSLCPLPFHTRIPVIGLRAHSNSAQLHLNYSIIASAKTLFPNKDLFCGLGGHEFGGMLFNPLQGN